MSDVSGSGGSGSGAEPIRMGKVIGSVEGIESGSGFGTVGNLDPVIAFTRCHTGPRKMAKYIADFPGYFTSGSGSGEEFVPPMPVYGYGECSTVPIPSEENCYGWDGTFFETGCCPGEPIPTVLVGTVFITSGECSCFSGPYPLLGLPLADGFSWDYNSNTDCDPSVPFTWSTHVGINCINSEFGYGWDGGGGLTNIETPFAGYHCYDSTSGTFTLISCNPFLAVRTGIIGGTPGGNCPCDSYTYDIVYTSPWDAAFIIPPFGSGSYGIGSGGDPTDCTGHAGYVGSGSGSKTLAKYLQGSVYGRTCCPPEACPDGYICNACSPGGAPTLQAYTITADGPCPSVTLDTLFSGFYVSTNGTWVFEDAGLGALTLSCESGVWSPTFDDPDVSYNNDVTTTDDPYSVTMTFTWPIICPGVTFTLTILTQP